MVESFYQVAEQIAVLDNTELFQFWSQHKDRLKSYNLIRATVGECNMPLPRRTELACGASIQGIFTTDHLLFLNTKIIENTSLLHTPSVDINPIVGFDSMIPRYFALAIAGQTGDSATKAYQLLDFCIANKLNYDFLPYLVENAPNAKDSETISGNRFSKNIEAIEIMRDLDKDHYLDTRQIRAMCSEAELKIRIDGLKDYLLEVRVKNLNEAMQNHSLSLLMILVATHIHFTVNPNNPDNRLEALLEYCDSTLGGMPMREIVYLLPLLTKTQQERQTDANDFFARIQRGQKDMLEKIHNMAWDFQTFRNLELLFPTSLKDGIFVVPHLVTFDRGLANLVASYSVKSVLMEEFGMCLPEPENFFDKIQDNGFDYSQMAQRYFSTESRAGRMARQTQIDFEPLIEIATNKLKPFVG